jgi:hypothetical protein
MVLERDKGQGGGQRFVASGRWTKDQEPNEQQHDYCHRGDEDPGGPGALGYALANWRNGRHLGWDLARGGLVPGASGPLFPQTGSDLEKSIDRSGVLLGIAAVAIRGKGEVAVWIVASAQVGTNGAN